MDTVDIPKVLKKHPEEWLLFEVLERDELDRPIQGRLLYHGTSRDELHEVAMEKLCPDNYIVFTGDPIPPDLVVVL